MNYRRLGSTGLRISELSLGSWVTFHNQAGPDDAVELMAAAYEGGMNFFDNAEAYAQGKSEKLMGAALKTLGWRRGSYLVSTKLYWGLHDTPLESNTLNRKYLLEGIAGSLERLGLDYVDLLYCHRADPDTPIEETVRAMHDIIERGQALYWGTSEWEPDEIVAAIEIAEQHHLHAPVVEQPQYNLFQQHRLGPAYRRVYEHYGYGATTWSPLASGLLTGKYNDGIPEGSRATVAGFDWLKDELTDAERIARVRALEPIARDLDATLAQLALAWCLQNDRVSSVITGASSLDQVRDNLGAVRVAGKLSADVLAAIDDIFDGPE